MQLRSLLRPIYLARRAGYWWYQRTHPNEPWLAHPAIRFLDRELKPDMAGFEWGSGKSTEWFAKRLGHLTSIEHNADWASFVQRELDGGKLSNVELRHIPLEHAEAGTYEQHYDPLPRYAAAVESLSDESLDFVLVDGWYRPVCALAALPKLKPGALLVIDNTDWQHPPHLHVPAHWPIVHQSRNVLTQTSIWRKS